MIILKNAISRREMLRGAGAALALPLLDGMVPALTALSETAAKPAVRFGAVYVPNGMVMKNWRPATEGVGFELPPILDPLPRSETSCSCCRDSTAHLLLGSEVVRTRAPRRSS